MTIRRHHLAEQDVATDQPRVASAPKTVRAPSFMRLLQVFARRVLRPGACVRPANQRRDSLILDAALFIRMGDLQRAYDLLSTYDRVFTCDPDYLNLLGVINEARGKRAIARRFYGVAICSDPTYAPAQVNMRRMYEMDTFGHTAIAVSIGDVSSHPSVAVACVARSKLQVRFGGAGIPACLEFPTIDHHNPQASHPAHWP